MSDVGHWSVTPPGPSLLLRRRDFNYRRQACVQLNGEMHKVFWCLGKQNAAECSIPSRGSEQLTLRLEVNLE